MTQFAVFSYVLHCSWKPEASLEVTLTTYYYFSRPQIFDWLLRIFNFQFSLLFSHGAVNDFPNCNHFLTLTLS